ncbi:hypothetical protein ACJX0J_040742, partial [Zea mays]
MSFIGLALVEEYRGDRGKHEDPKNTGSWFFSSTLIKTSQHTRELWFFIHHIHNKNKKIAKILQLIKILMIQNRLMMTPYLIMNVSKKGDIWAVYRNCAFLQDLLLSLFWKEKKMIPEIFSEKSRILICDTTLYIGLHVTLLKIAM